MFNKTRPTPQGRRRYQKDSTACQCKLLCDIWRHTQAVKMLGSVCTKAFCCCLSERACPVRGPKHAAQGIFVQRNRGPKRGLVDNSSKSSMQVPGERSRTHPPVTQGKDHESKHPQEQGVGLGYTRDGRGRNRTQTHFLKLLEGFQYHGTGHRRDQLMCRCQSNRLFGGTRSAPSPAA